MKTRILHERAARTHLLVLETGDEAAVLLREYVRAHLIQSAYFSAIGAFSYARLGFFDPQRRNYREHEVKEQTEVLGLLGNVSWLENEPRIHAHATLGRADGSTLGGHLLEARVHPTLEVFLVESPSGLHRRVDPRSGLPLMDVD